MYRQQLAELELIYATAPIGLCFHDRQFRFIRINEQMASFNGVPVAEHIGRTIYEVIPEFADYIAKILQSVIDSGHPLLNYEFRAQAPGCTEERDWLGNYYPVKDASGNILGVNVMVQDITERKRAEVRLQEQAQIIDQIHDSVIATDLQGMITSWNQGAVRLFGYQSQEAIGQPISLLYPTPAMQEVLQTQVIEPLLAKGDHEIEVQMQRKSGEVMDALLSLSILRDSQQNPVRMIGYSMDITDRKQAEAGLRRSQAIAKQQLAEIEAIYRTAPIGLCVLDTNLRFVRVNQQLAEINGLDAAAHLGQSITELLPELAAAQMAYFQQALLGIPVHNVEIQGKTLAQPGQLRTWLVNYDPLKDAADRILGINITVKEITERKRGEQLQQFLAEVGSILTTSSDETAMLTEIAKLTVPILADCCFFDLLQEGRWQRVAWQPTQVESSLDQLAFLPQIATHSDRSRLPPLDSAPILIAEEDWLDAFAINPAQLQALRDLQLRSLIVAPLVVQDRRLGLLTFGMTQASQRSYTSVEQDLIGTLAKQMAMTIDNARLYQVSQQANRVKDEFLAVLSHELRSPLNPILGWSRLLQTRAFEPAKMQEALATIERNAQLQAQLIEDLLDISRILQGKLSLEMAPVQLMAVIAAAIETMQLAIESKSLQLQFIWIDAVRGEQRLDPFKTDLAQLYDLDPLLQFSTVGDAARLQQGIWNLLSNAVKFTPAGGSIQIYLENLSLPAAVAYPEGATDGAAFWQTDRSPKTTELLQITVQDNGKGIAPEFLPYVFDYFRQADSTTTRQFGGLGLGLAIVRQVVELHGGTVQAESSGPGQGATFRIRLPKLQPKLDRRASTPDQQDSPSSDLPLNGYEIWVVDDEPDSRELMAFVLVQAGAVVMQLASAADTLARFAAQTSPLPDLLISDIGMPVMDGYGLLRQIRNELSASQLPAIALTAYAGEANAKQALQAGFQFHLAKPVDPNRLIAAIIELMKSRSHSAD